MVLQRNRMGWGLLVVRSKRTKLLGGGVSWGELGLGSPVAGGPWWIRLDVYCERVGGGQRRSPVHECVGVADECRGEWSVDGRRSSLERTDRAYAVAVGCCNAPSRPLAPMRWSVLRCARGRALVRISPLGGGGGRARDEGRGRWGGCGMGR